MYRYSFAVVLGLGFLGVSIVQAQPVEQQNTPASLKRLCEKLQQAIVQNDTKTINTLGFGLMPDEARLRTALRDDVAAEDVKQIMSMHVKFKDGARGNAARLFSIKPEQTEVQLSTASTEDLVEKREPSKQFPGGALDVAGKWLKPGTTFYQVSFVKPGEKLGMKFHLFYWDGKQWSMLGPLWRAGK